MILFFFKQKTAYEMRISDWSSDVCSSDLQQAMGQQYQKWLLIVRLPNETGMVVVTVPEAALGTGAYSSADFDTALATLAYGDSATADPLTTLPFIIEEGELQIGRAHV